MQQYHVPLVGLGWVGSNWGFGYGQAGPCMGRCRGGAGVVGGGDDVYGVWGVE